MNTQSTDHKKHFFITLSLLLIAAILSAGISLPVDAAEPIDIEPGPETVLPDYIGAPAKAHPSPNTGVPQNPLLWPNPFNSVHMDPWNSDVVDIAGPLGRDPVAFTSTLADARQNVDSIEFQCVFMTYTSHGRMITSCFGIDEASVLLLNPETLEVYDHYDLPVVPPEEAPSLFDAQGLNGLSASYLFFDKDERLFNAVKDELGNNKIIVLVEGGSDASPTLEPDPEQPEYDMSKWVSANNRLVGLALDWEGRIWFYLSGMAATPTSPGIPGAVGVFYPEKYPQDDAVQFYMFQDPDEQIRNTMAITKSGVYVVTSKQMYRIGLDAEGKPQIVWGAPYDNVGYAKPGSYNAGSGTSPTILGEGKYVAITDNAEPDMQVVVYRTEPDEELEPGENRIVCKVPVFQYAEGGSLDNSLLGSRLSLIVENNYGYVLDLETMTLTGGEPGFERIDIDPNGRGCTKVWVNTKVASTTSAKLSTRTGLIYTFSRKYDDQNQVWAYYWTALDFRTGEVVWEKLAGTGHEKFEHFWPALYVGPSETLYVGLFGGLAAMRDAP
jgi:hypothetical protein